MKRAKVLQDLNQCLTSISQMQQNGQIQLPSKVAFGLSKNLNKVKSMQVEFLQYQKDRIREFCNCDTHGNPKMIDVPQEGKAPLKKWDFKKNKKEEDLQDIFNNYMDEEVTFEPHKISMSDIQVVHNLPVVNISILDEFGILTESKTLSII